MLKASKVPMVFQMEAVECGASALGMVLGYYQLYIPLEELRERCNVTRDGVSAASIVKAARYYGLEAKAYRKEISELHSLPFPQIIFWGFDHFLVIESLDDKFAQVCDPAFGKRKIALEEFDKHYTGITISLAPGEQFNKGGQRENAISSLVARVSGSWVDMNFVVLLSFLTIIPGLTVPALSRVYVDYYLVDKHETWFLPIILGLAASGIILASLSYLQDAFLLKFRNKFSLIYSSKFFWRIMRMNVHFFSHRFTGDLGNRLMLNDQVAGQISGPLASSFLHLTTVFVYLAVLLQYDVTLTLVGLGGIALNIAIVRIFSKGLADSSKKTLMDRSKVSSIALHGLSMIENVKVTASENNLFAKVMGLHAKAVSGEQKLGLIRNLYQGISEWVLNLNMLAVLILGSIKVMQGSITLGMFVGFQALMLYLQKPIRNLVMLSGSMQEMAGGLSRIDDVLQSPYFTEEKDEPDGEVESSRFDGEISITNLHYHFGTEGPWVINDINLEVSAGQWIGITGNSGCGKTTFARLLAGLYSNSTGQVLYSGKDQQFWGKLLFRNKVTYIPDTPQLFQGTVRENLTLWDDAIDERDLMNACQAACIHDALHNRSGAYDAKVEFSGNNFSGGEIQRIAIARALIRKPAVMILDESTSALDVLTERELLCNLKHLPITVIMLSHKVSALDSCDRLFELREGALTDITGASR